MEALERTTSRESVRSRGSSHHLSAAVTPPMQHRKSRFVDADTSNADVERASISMPPPNSRLSPRQYSSRRLSKASDVSISLHSSTPSPEHGTRTRNSAVIDDMDSTPTIDGMKKAPRSPTGEPGSLPDAAPIQPRSDLPDLESNRMSFSSLYSLGSNIYDRARGAMPSAPSSVAGSEPDGTSNRGLDEDKMLTCSQ